MFHKERWTIEELQLEHFDFMYDFQKSMYANFIIVPLPQWHFMK